MLPLVAGMAASVLGNMISTSMNNKNQENASALNYKRQTDFWNMQNQYNNPSHQVERLVAAGLNPNLIYGSGSSSAAGNASGSVSPQMPNLQPYRFDALANMGQLMLQQKSVDADVRNKDSLSRYNEVKAQSEFLTMIGKEYENALKSEDYGRAVRLRDLRDNVERKGYELLSHNADYAAYHAQNEENENVLFDLTIDARVKKYFKDNDLTSAQIRVANATVFRLQAATALDWKQCAVAAKKIALLSEEISSKQRENRFGDETYEARVQLVSAELVNLLLSGDRAKLENYLKGRGFDDSVVRQARALYNMLFHESDLPKAQNYYDYGF